MTQTLLQQWNDFKRETPKVCYGIALIGEASQCLAHAFTEVATSYQNEIVEKFANKLICYLWYHIHTMFVSMNPNDVHNIAPLRDILNTRVKLKTLSEFPAKFIPLLTRLLSSIESEHNSHCEYDMMRIPLPQRFIKKSKNRISQYHMTSSTRYSSELNKLKKDNSTNIIESAIPTDKTSGPEKYLQHVAYIRQNLSTLFKFYSAVTEKKPLFLVPRKAKGTRVDGEHAA
ncbi:hypothetical protein PHYBLDRAFT_153741 [Phycomyces blakesleeanus NRRL 1555(-)]|uniref:Uncharacterized protein n=1 Tax=Phycomyces blakesleeanus (strain ATCC 8743b / DSM 1359 / FGSC 10004 / NBRC 33097 / NRRL 1555) TaxID=763407 RepID=A0A162PFB1_PHYB8|nr:hypothetical protein PHYBLDRAFT_153741 [Phycomyces blakesleeanus NRRL 1555(-)]OAD65146.1 hypothetical protein PHYBLDRAFT_153741 [Phycomyces blakesleeanus NRRL 1555(-)]|eukprot:XP_018283186.1 hypothetical protein PHYBLDRAFT_153741 [Phycomyces blakesleeanus NRRL 1555(-)]